MIIILWKKEEKTPAKTGQRTKEGPPPVKQDLIKKNFADQNPKGKVGHQMMKTRKSHGLPKPERPDRTNPNRIVRHTKNVLIKAMMRKVKKDHGSPGPKNRTQTNP